MQAAEMNGVARATTETSTRARAAATIAGALAAGTITQMLLWDARIGLSWLLLDVLLVVGAFGVVGAGRRPSSGALFLAVGVIASGAAVVWYASDWSLGFGVLTNVAMLVALPFAVESRWRIADLGRVPSIVYDGARRTPRAIAEAATLPAHALDDRGRSHAWSIVKGLAVGAPITLVFVGLLAADDAFSGAVMRAVSASGEAIEFAIACLGAAAAFLVARVLFSRRDAQAAPEAASAQVPYRNVGDLAAPPAPVAEGEAPRGPRVRPLAWAAVLAQLVVVFGVFAAVNARTLFGGHALVRAPGPLTYARYLHAGFTQLSIATLLAVVTVLVGHALLRPRGSCPRAVPGGRAIAALEATLLLLVAVALASCAQRLLIYEDAYGYTYERLFVGFFQLGVLALIALTFAKSIARGWRGYASAIVVAGGALAVGMSWFDADGWIARHNIARAIDGKLLDATYLGSLSEDARPALNLLKATPPGAITQEQQSFVEEQMMLSAQEHLRSGWRSARGLRNAW